MNVKKCMLVLFSLSCLTIMSCEEAESPTSTFWFYTTQKFGGLWVHIDGKNIGSPSYVVNSASEIGCNSSKGIQKVVYPGTYFIEIYDDLGRRTASKKYTISETGKCYPVKID